VIRY